MKINRFTFSLSTRIVFGNGVIAGIGKEVRSLGAEKILLVVDQGIIKAGLLDKVMLSLEKENLKSVLFDKVEPEPWVELADACGQVARKEGCKLVVGIGGGSAMDVAKAGSVLATNSGTARDYQGLNKVPTPGLPKVMVPTTAGTGSEVTFTSVLSNKETREKAGINSPFLFPEVALLDPELTVSLPPPVTASTGMDALAHAVESYTSLIASPMTETISLEAIRLIAKNLHRAVSDPGDIEARNNMLMASLLAGISLANAGVTAVHALAYPLGGVHRIAHGVANGLLLPYVMEFNLEGSPGKFSEIARAFGRDPKPGNSVVAVRELSRSINLPQKLSDIKIPEKDISEMAQKAIKVSRPIENNPKKVTIEDLIMIYRQAF